MYRFLKNLLKYCNNMCVLCYFPPMEKSKYRIYMGFYQQSLTLKLLQVKFKNEKHLDYVEKG